MHKLLIFFCFNSIVRTHIYVARYIGQMKIHYNPNKFIVATEREDLAFLSGKCNREKGEERERENMIRV